MKAFVFLTTTALFLSACVSSTPVVATDGSIITPNRTLPERMTDVSIEHTILSNIKNIDGMQAGNHRVAANSHQGIVLLTGEVPNAHTRTAIENMAKSIREVKLLFNHLTITDIPKSPSHTTHETYLKSKIQAKLLLNPTISTTQYTVEVRNDIAYVIGAITQEQKQIIQNTIASIDGMVAVHFFGDLLLPASSPLPPNVAPASTVAVSPIIPAVNTPINTLPTQIPPQPIPTPATIAPTLPAAQIMPAIPQASFDNGITAYNPTHYNHTMPAVPAVMPQPTTNMSIAYPIPTQAYNTPIPQYQYTPMPQNNPTQSSYIQLYQGTGKP